jgi:hypothetical protein
MSLEAKRKEIEEYAAERVAEIAAWDEDKLNDVYDLHNEIFNMDYYIVGYYQAAQWLGTDTFEAIGMIQDYEKEHFGEVHTDLGSSENVANMLAYILGEEVIQEVVEEYLEQREEEEEEEGEE